MTHLTNDNNPPIVGRRALLLGTAATLVPVLGSVVFSAEASAATLPTLRSGMKGTAVKQLQDALSVRGIPCGRFGSDSSYGVSTKTAVTEYQRLWGLVADGVAGPKTQAHIASHPRPHPKIIARLSPRWKESGTIAIVDKMGRRGSPPVSNVARIYLFREARLLRTIQARTGGYAYDKKISKWVYKNTPTGAFRVWVKIEDGYSNRYEADMPYFTVFTTNIGFHYSAGFRANNYGPAGTGNYGSHGCVNIGNLPDARLVFGSLTEGRNQVLVQQT
jgi:hypothetical protein